jgi:hypothetical protein
MSRVVVDLFLRSLLCFGIALAVYGVVRPDAPRPAPQCVAAPPAVFGIVDGRGAFVPTDVVPLVVGQEFGENLEVTDNGLVGVTERTERARGGVLEHGWIITEGDPAGPYELQLFVDGWHVQTFRFVLR